MEISAGVVRDLREKTGAGMMDCKKALQEAGGDADKALDILRTQGLAAASKKSGRVASEGLTSTAVSSDGRRAAIIEVNCETDFVAKNDDFKQFADTVSKLVLEKNTSNLDEVLSLTIGSQKVSEVVNALVAKIGEKITLRRVALLSVDAGQKIGDYIHLGSKIGVLVAIKGQADGTILKDVAMHVAAAAPQYLSKQDIPQDVIDKEKAIYLEQLKESGKPEAVLEKIVEGKAQKFASDICLQEQIFIKDPTGKKSVKQFLKDSDASLEVISFVRYQVGEGIEKKKEDFAEEVAKMVK